MDAIVALVALFSLIFYFLTSLNVAKARRASGIDAPAMTGHPQLERAVRVQMNTLEWTPIYLVTLGLFDVFVPKPYGPWGAAALGIVWIIGRVLYQNGYMADPSKRSTGFMVQTLACLVLLLGALGGAGWSLYKGG